MYLGGFMANTQILITQAYSAFNRRDINSALVLMSENVSWPKASEGGRVVGKEEIRSYWTRQWKEFDPHVEPLEVIDREGGITDVKVHQLVKSLGGDVLSDSEVCHVYTGLSGRYDRCWTDNEHQFHWQLSVGRNLEWHFLVCARLPH